MATMKMVQNAFEKLCERYELTMPVIDNVEQDAEDVSDDVISGAVYVKDTVTTGNYHAFHLFGHWLCQLATTDPDMEEEVADIIQGLLDNTDILLKRAYCRELGGKDDVVGLTACANYRGWLKGLKEDNWADGGIQKMPKA